MVSYIIRRILIIIPLLFGISVISFGIVQMAPGDPVSMMTGMDKNVTPADRQKKIEAYGLNDPIPVQYVRWLEHIGKGDFGDSIIQPGVAVSELILARLPNTLLLMLTSAIMAILISIPFGVWSATRPYTLTDNTITTASFLGLATPNFWLGLILIMFLAVKLPWFPAGGVATTNEAFSIWDRIHHLILPAFVLGTADMAGLVRYTRSSMLEVLHQDYIRTARAKGFKGGRVVYKHGLRNGLIPVITVTAAFLPSFVGGAALTETIFNWPGLGLLFVDSAFQLDYPVIMAILMITATLIVFSNLIADILYAIFDPRIEY